MIITNLMFMFMSWIVGFCIATLVFLHKLRKISKKTKEHMKVTDELLNAFEKTQVPADGNKVELNLKYTRGRLDVMSELFGGK